MAKVHTHEPTGKFDVVTIGESLVSLEGEPGRLERSRFMTKSIGGAESNVAIGLARLGLRVSFNTAVGDDPFGSELISRIRAEGVDVTHVIRRNDFPTGLMVKELRGPQDIRVFYYRSGSAASTMSFDDFPLEQTRHLHFTGITLAVSGRARQSLFRRIKDLASSATVSFDPNFRMKLAPLREQVAWSRQILPHVTDLLCTEAEAFALTDTASVPQALDALNRYGIKNIVIRQGAKGCVGSSGGVTHDVPAPRVEVVDTVGAGDGFTAGYLFERLAGNPFVHCLRTGSWVAGEVISHRGDFEGLPNLRDYRLWDGQRNEIER